jgi:hypothetical protein
VITQIQYAHVLHKRVLTRDWRILERYPEAAASILHGAYMNPLDVLPMVSRVSLPEKYCACAASAVQVMTDSVGPVSTMLRTGL